MRLLFVHKILISTAIAATGAFAAHQVWIWRGTRAPVTLAIAGGAVAVAVLLAMYLRRVIHKGIGAGATPEGR